MDKESTKELLKKLSKVHDEKDKTYSLIFDAVKEIVDGKATNQSEIKEILKFLRKSRRSLNESIFNLKNQINNEFNISLVRLYIAEIELINEFINAIKYGNKKNEKKNF